VEKDDLAAGPMGRTIENLIRGRGEVVSEKGLKNFWRSLNNNPY